MITVQEINTYNNLAKKGFVQKITCPFDESDLIITKVDSDLNPFFYCLGCNSSFSPGNNTESKIKRALDKFKDKA